MVRLIMPVSLVVLATGQALASRAPPRVDLPLIPCDKVDWKARLSACQMIVCKPDFASLRTRKTKPVQGHIRLMIACGRNDADPQEDEQPCCPFGQRALRCPRNRSTWTPDQVIRGDDDWIVGDREDASWAGNYGRANDPVNHFRLRVSGLDHGKYSEDGPQSAHGCDNHRQIADCATNRDR